MTYYERVEGLDRDKKAMDAARAAVAGAGDGRVSIADADAIAKTLLDGHGVTAIEYSTAFLVMRDFHFTPEAMVHFVKILATAPVDHTAHHHAPHPTAVA